MELWMSKHLYIVTGASKGMGRAMAEQLLQQSGNHLLLMARSPIELQAQEGTQLEQWSCDLTQAEQVAERLQQWLQALRPEDFASATLINNAAQIPPIAPLSDTNPAALVQALRVGLEAPMLLTQAFLQALAAWTCSKKVLNISSGLGRRPMASQATYCAVKAGLDNFSQSLALEEMHKPHGARVCSLAPGVVDTAMQEQLRTAAAELFPDAGRFVNLHRQGLLTSPQDAAAQVLAWLARENFGQAVLADVRDA